MLLRAALFAIEPKSQMEGLASHSSAITRKGAFFCGTTSLASLRKAR